MCKVVPFPHIQYLIVKVTERKGIMSKWCGLMYDHGGFLPLACRRVLTDWQWERDNGGKKSWVCRPFCGTFIFHVTRGEMRSQVHTHTHAITHTFATRWCCECDCPGSYETHIPHFSCILSLPWVRLWSFVWVYDLKAIVLHLYTNTLSISISCWVF